MLLSKCEANQMLCLRVTHASFSLFPLASSCLNNDCHAYAIIIFFANQLGFPNVVTIAFINMLQTNLFSS